MRSILRFFWKRSGLDGALTSGRLRPRHCMRSTRQAVPLLQLQPLSPPSNSHLPSTSPPPPCSSSTGSGMSLLSSVCLGLPSRLLYSSERSRCRPSAQERQNPVPRSGQRWQDRTSSRSPIPPYISLTECPPDPLAHAEERPPCHSATHPSPECVSRANTLIHMYSDPVLASEELAIGNVKFTTYDLGGHQQGTSCKPPRSRAIAYLA